MTCGTDCRCPSCLLRVACEVADTHARIAWIVGELLAGRPVALPLSDS